MDLGIQGRTAVVLASSAGLGRAIAFALAAEGANVALSGREPEKLAANLAEMRKRFGERVFGEPLNVTNGEALTAHLNAARERFGAVDILVTNAGGPPAGRATEMTMDSLDQAYALTLKSAVRAIVTVLPWMQERKWGRIIAVTSQSVREPIPNLVLSNIMRPALTGYLKTLSAEIASEGILVNSVCTGAFETDRLISLCQSRATASGRTPEAEMRAIAASIPVGRIGRPEEYAALVAFLASEQAGFLTGVAIPLDGGVGHGLY